MNYTVEKLAIGAVVYTFENGNVFTIKTNPGYDTPEPYEALGYNPNPRHLLYWDKVTGDKIEHVEIEPYKTNLRFWTFEEAEKKMFELAETTK